MDDGVDDLYQRGYRKVARVDELSVGAPRIYRTGGSFVLLLRSRFGVRAADVTSCVDAGATATAEERLQNTVECLDDDAASRFDWNAVIEDRQLPVETPDGEVWVCVD